MALRQYIGARYVPKFDGVHDISKSYEPLTIVTDAGATTSYTSKKMVPVGIALNNEEYWAITGTLSGALIDIQLRVGALENAVKPFNSERNVAWIGDSWSVGGLSRNVNELMNFNSFFHNEYGGSGFVATGDSPATDKTFTKLLQNLCDTMTPAQKESIEYLIVAGGVNDNPYLSQIVNAVKDFIDIAKTLLPNARIYIVACNQLLHGTNDKIAYVNELIKVNGYGNAFVVNATETALITEYANNGHLSDYRTVASAVVSGVKGIPFKQGKSQKNVHYSIPALNIENKDFTIFQKNNSIYAYIQTAYFNGNYAFTGVLALDFECGDYLFPYVDGESLIMSVNAKYQGDSNYTAVPAILTFNPSGFKLTIYGKSSATLVELLIPPYELKLFDL